MIVWKMGKWLVSYCIITLLIAGCSGTESATATPTELPTEIPTLVPSLTPSITPPPPPTFQPLTATPSPIPSETAIPLDPLMGEPVPPPVEFNLPDDWQFGYDIRVFSDIGELRAVPFSFYTGPVTGGQGFIVMLWDFPNVIGNPFLESGQPNLYHDGLRYLRLLIVEAECNIGTDVQKIYEIAGREANGTIFSAIDCPDELPDTRGWFAGVWEQNVPFLFYAYTEPITAMDGEAQDELQAFLDSAVFELNREDSGE